MKAILFALFAIMASTATAMTPDELRGATITHQTACTDHESGDSGHCYLLDYNGEIYLVFHDRDSARFVRHVRPGFPYVTVWHRDGLKPQGTSL